MYKLSGLGNGDEPQAYTSVGVCNPFPLCMHAAVQVKLSVGVGTTGWLNNGTVIQSSAILLTDCLLLTRCVLLSSYSIQLL